MTLRVLPQGLPVPAGAALRRAVFLDKDGTLIENVPYNADPARLRFTARAAYALRRLAAAGYLLIVVSNQPGIALRRFDRAALTQLAQALARRLAVHGVVLDGFYACPHAPLADRIGPACRCRKPAPGLLLAAARDFGIELERSWMIGDILDDVEAGWRAGSRTVLLDVGNETEWHWSPVREPERRVADLGQAADAILAAPAAARGRPATRRPTVRRPAGAGRRDAWVA